MAEPTPGGETSDEPHGGQGQSTEADAPGQRGDGDNREAGKPKKRRPKGPIILIAVVAGAILLIGALLYWLHARNYQSTDDAFIDTHIVRLAPQVAGRVTQVLVNDNQLVDQGQLLIRLDSADAETRVAQAQAQQAQAEAGVENAQAQVAVNQAGYQQAQAQVAAAQAQADDAARDFTRYRNLQALNTQAVAQQQFDQAQAQARQTAAQLASAQKAAAAKASEVAASRTQVTSGQDQLRAAQSQLNEAQVNLGYSQISAPVSGHIAQKTVALGNYAQAGTELLAIVPLQVWVTANFKESQLALMRPGQPVAIRVDACPGEHINGHVDSIQRGAGQAFAILPPENATGNYVKVVQRVPVKIVFDNPPNDCPLGPGMSVEPRVRVR